MENSAGTPRLTHQLTLADGQRALDWAEAAQAASAAPNLVITLDLELAGIAPQACPAAIAQYIKYYQQWITRHGGAAYWLRVQENSPRAGCHVHILCHVPPEFMPLLGRWPLIWAKRVLGAGYRSGLFHRRWLVAPADTPEVYAAALRLMLHYILKGAPAELEARLGMVGWGSALWGKTGAIYGRRLSVSQVGRARRVCAVARRRSAAGRRRIAWAMAGCASRSLWCPRVEFVRSMRCVAGHRYVREQSLTVFVHGYAVAVARADAQPQGEAQAQGP